MKRNWLVSRRAGSWYFAQSDSCFQSTLYKLHADGAAAWMSVAAVERSRTDIRSANLDYSGGYFAEFPNHLRSGITRSSFTSQQISLSYRRNTSYEIPCMYGEVGLRSFEDLIDHSFADNVAIWLSTKNEDIHDFSLCRKIRCTPYLFRSLQILNYNIKLYTG